ncbi:MAG: hypothetical protein KDA77_22625, partial [Planctomycetaceae bacterium]|nr:hypothetical protein [Planctomycetaceae bacterium]
MEHMEKSTQLIDRVQRRLALALWGRSLFISFVCVLSAYLVMLLFSRFSGYLREWFPPESLGIVVVGTLMLSFVFFRKPDKEQAARLIDQNQGTKDLFLTVTM